MLTIKANAMLFKLATYAHLGCCCALRGASSGHAVLLVRQATA